MSSESTPVVGEGLSVTGFNPLDEASDDDVIAARKEVVDPHGHPRECAAQTRKTRVLHPIDINELVRSLLRKPHRQVVLTSGEHVDAEPQ